MRELSLLFSALLVFPLLFSACGGTPAPAPEIHRLILATTTSTQDSGLLDVLVPVFEAQTGYVVQVVAVGSGQALEMGEEGNADVLLVHSPAAEQTFMNDGFGSDRRLVMHNDFIVVGPASDPARISGMTAAEAFAAIAAAGSDFVSRGDDSGTHRAELKLWGAAGITPQGGWYQESGQGMAATLTIASELAAYTLTDRATFLANRLNLNLEILVEADAALLNVYHVIIVNPQKWPGINLAGATAFADFIVSPDVQATIGKFGIEQFGQPLFFPDAGKDESELGLP